MSDSVSLKFQKPITSEEWLKFCNDHDIQFSPHTAGENVFYSGGTFGVEIWFGYENGTLPKLPNGDWDFANAQPSASADKIVVRSCYESISGMAKMILAHFPGEEVK